MKITGLEFARRVTPAIAAAGQATRTLRLHDALGNTGTAQCPLDCCDFAQALATELLLGEDPHAHPVLGQRLLDACSARRGHGMQAAAALDIALWDLKANILGEPLWRLVGGSSPRVRVEAGSPPVAATTGSAELPLEWYARQVREYGVGGARLAPGAGLQADSLRARELGTLLAAGGTEPVLVVETVAAWQSKEAIRYLHALECEVDIARIEWPEGSGDPAAWRAASRSLRAAVCVRAGQRGGEALQTLLQHRSVDVVGLDTAWHGITGVLQLADAAFAFELPVVLADSPGNLHVHIGGALATCAAVQMRDPLLEPQLRSGIRFAGGRGLADDRPGHGIGYWPRTEPAP